MYRRCTAEHSSRRQQSIENSLFRMLQSCNFEDITVSELAKRANIPRRTFYFYFDTKEDVLNALFDHTMMEYATFKPEGITNVWERFFEFCLVKKDFLDTLQRCKLNSTFFLRSILMMETEPDILQEGFEVNMKKMTRQTMLFIISGLTTLVLDWNLRGCRETPAEMAQIFEQMVTRPLLMKSI